MEREDGPHRHRSQAIEHDPHTERHVGEIRLYPDRLQPLCGFPRQALPWRAIVTATIAHLGGHDSLLIASRMCSTPTLA